MTSNIDNLGNTQPTTNASTGLDQAGYLALQAALLGASGSQEAAADASSLDALLLSYFNSNFTYDVNFSLLANFKYANVSGTYNDYPTAYLNLLDAQDGNVSVTIPYAYPVGGALSDQYGANTPAAGQNANLTYINSSTQSWVVVPIGDAYMSLPDISNIYTKYAADIASGAWNTASFWQNTTDPELQQFYQYFSMLNDDINKKAQGTTTLQNFTAPPTSALDFFTQVIQKATIWNPTTATSFDPTAFNGAKVSSLSSQNQTALQSNLTRLGAPFSPTQVIDFTATTKEMLDGASSDFYSSVDLSNITTPAQLVQSYLNYLSSTNSSTNLESTLKSLTGQTVPLNFSFGGQTVSMGTMTLPDLTGAVLPDNSVLTGLSSSDIANISSTFSSDLYSIFDQAYQASGIASNAAIAAMGETTLFNNTFATFMNGVSSGQIKVSSLGDLVQQWSLFVGPSVVLSASGSTDAMMSYEQIYNTFFPGGTGPGFLTILNNFINSFVSDSNGVFNSSLMADQWYSLVQNSYLNSIGLSPVGKGSPLSQANFNQTKIILELYSMLISMLGDIQKMTAAQVKYDNLLVDWEAAYTKAIAGIPDNLIGSNIPGGQNVNSSMSSAQLQVQSSLESQISNATQKWISNLTAFNTQISNQEKAQTTTISQSNEAANQQVNLINSILQELQSLLQSIWR